MRAVDRPAGTELNSTGALAAVTNRDAPTERNFTNSLVEALRANDESKPDPWMT